MPVKRAVALTALLAIAAVGGAVAYRSTVRERSYRLLIASGEAALAADQTLAAIESFSGAIAVRPDAMLPRLRRGETYRRRRDFEEAARDFRQAASLDSTATRPLEELADVLFAQERFSRAAETYEARLRLDDRSAPGRYKLALARYKAGTVDLALEAVRRAIALDDQLPDAYYLEALCLRDMEQPDAAIQALERAVTEAPGLIAAREELAELYEGAGRFAEQLDQLQVLAALDKRPERHAAIGLAQARAGQPDLAVLTLASALKAGGDRAALQAALGRVWLEIAEARPDRRDALPRALESLERAASALTATSEVKALYGRALARAGQLEAAEQVFQQATERLPVEPVALLHYADVAERLAHADIARAALVDYVALVPDRSDSAAYASRIGRLSLAAHDPAGALPWLERAAAAAPTDTSALASLADAQLALDRPSDARATVDRGLGVERTHRQLLALDRRLDRLGY